MQKKGFTLVELLVMLLVLGVLIAVTIPNISGILKNQRLNKWKADGQNLIEITKTYISKKSTTTSNDLIKPGIGECVIFTLDYIDANNDIKTGPNGGSYEDFDSFVVYTKESTGSSSAKWVYYVQLVEDSSEGKVGLKLKKEEKLETIANSDISNSGLILGLGDNEETSTLSLTNFFNGKEICTNGIRKYYARKK